MLSDLDRRSTRKIFMLYLKTVHYIMRTIPLPSTIKHSNNYSKLNLKFSGLFSHEYPKHAFPDTTQSYYSRCHEHNIIIAKKGN